MATPADQKCLLPTCSKSGQLNTFKLQAVKKLIECAVECAVERQDCEIQVAGCFRLSWRTSIS